jgi:hypothetical protein
MNNLQSRRDLHIGQEGGNAEATTINKNFEELRI